MKQDELFHETIYDALSALINALGGPKKIGSLLWPAKPLKEAQRRVLHCLDPEREEKFSPEEVLFLMIEGQKANCHIMALFIGQQCFYEFTVVSPADRSQQLMRDFIEMGKSIERTAQQIFKLNSQ